MQDILVSYIKQSSSEGFTKEQTQQKLLASGYEAHEIATAYSVYEHDKSYQATVLSNANSNKAVEHSLLNKIFLAPLSHAQFRTSYLALFAINLIVFIGPYPYAQATNDSAAALGPLAILSMISVFGFVFVFLSTAAQINIIIRRLRKLEMSAWWYIVFFIPVIGSVLFIYILFKSDNN